VRDRQIVDSRTTTISTQEDKMRLILVTCYPFHAIVPGGPLRYMIIAETVERMAEDKPARLARKAGRARWTRV
jgi:sortase A